MKKLTAEQKQQRNDYMREYAKRPHVLIKIRAYRKRRAKNRNLANSIWKKTHKARVNEHARASIRRLKLRTFAVFGSKCKRCGFLDHRALQIDHILGAGNIERSSPLRSGQKLYRYILQHPECRERYQLLCANCNWIKKFERQETTPIAWRA